MLRVAKPGTMVGVRWLVVLASLPLTLVTASRHVQLNYDFEEERPIGSFVADVKHDANLTSIYEASVVEQLRFTFMRQYSTRLFDVNEVSGVLRSSARVDREQLCPAAGGGGGVEECTVRVDVAVRPIDHFTIIRIIVNVIDINDHVPAFPDRQLTADVLESASVGTTIVLPLAFDPDNLPFTVVEYQATPDDGSDVFRLVYSGESVGGGGFGALRLELVAPLDRELVDVYRMTIMAVDGGNPPLTGSAELTVKVIDVNDNRPRFEHAEYSVTVSEDVAAGTTLMNVVAVDPDNGANGQVTYEIMSTAASTSGGNSLPFGVDNTTGAVVVLTSLDCDRGPSTYQFAISATDMGPDAVATTCVVVVQLTDVNDNAPEIVVDGLLAAESETVWPSPASSSVVDTARVTENARQGTFVAHVTVIDPDVGDAGRFNCSLTSSDDNVNATDYFRLNQFEETEFQLVTSAASNQIDHERQIDFRFAVICADMGKPPLTSQQQVRVLVADINDCAPTFARHIYEAEIIENNYVGASLLTVSASDADRGDNARLRYSLVGPQSSDFRIDASSGHISAVATFDREATPTVSFIVVARDAGIPSMSGSATVVVSVIDVNDNWPQFDAVEYVLRVDENQPSATFVGQVSAVDPDSRENSNLSYAIVSDVSFVWSSAAEVSAPESVHAVFDLDPITGAVVTKQPLDAEAVASYRFQVIAIDSGIPPRSATASVVITVEDINDNAPQFVFPSSASGNVLYVATATVPASRVIVAVSATDPDVAPSSSLVYTLTDNCGCFQIDRLSGLMSLVDGTSLVGKENGSTFEVTLTATDDGGLATSETLYVVVNSSASTALIAGGSGRWEALAVGSRQVLIFSCLVVVCGVFVVGLVGVIAAIRSRRRRSAAESAAEKRWSRRYNCRAAACLRLQQNGAGSAADVVGHGHRLASPVKVLSSTDRAAQTSLLQKNGDCRNGNRPMMRWYSDDECLNNSQLNGSLNSLKCSPNVACRQVQLTNTLFGFVVLRVYRFLFYFI